MGFYSVVDHERGRHVTGFAGSLAKSMLRPFKNLTIAEAERFQQPYERRLRDGLGLSSRLTTSLTWSCSFSHILITLVR